jgi:3-oxoacid CoA-transferase subunit B
MDEANPAHQCGKETVKIRTAASFSDSATTFGIIRGGKIDAPIPGDAAVGDRRHRQPG